MPAKLPPAVVTTVFRVNQECDPRCLYIKVTVLPRGTAGSECLTGVTWPEKGTVLCAGKAEGRIRVVCVSICLTLALTLGIEANNKTKTATIAVAMRAFRVFPVS